MSESSPHSHGSDGVSASHPVMDRVLARVRDAQVAGDRQPRTRRLDASGLADSAGRSPEQRREARALRRVFVDLRDSYREYRRRTGASVSPEVKEAASRFRRDRDLASLVSVAASLDRLKSLSW